MTVSATKDDLELVGTVPLFAGLARKAQREVAGHFKVRTVAAGKQLTTEGKNGRDFFVVLDGIARCDVGGVTVRRFERGDYFGELALITGSPRSATIVAETPMTLFILDRRDFNNLLWSSPATMMKVLRSIAVRLQETDPRLAD
ncbi:MAG: cyclic nucleotide-binding domain-containing protein [Acidimicrobiia bacterium]